VFIAGDESPARVSRPPIKLQNNFLARTFEFLTSLYGLPSYGEIDPTMVLAATYTTLFGIMFADAGQGAALALAGFFLYKKKGFTLGSIISVIGVSSALFGLLFGSVFGYEFHSVAISPADSQNSTSFLIFAIISGIGLILTSMLINLLNAAKKNKLKEYLFEPNGVAGIIFYVSSIAIIYLSAIEKISVPPIFIIIFIAAPILAAAFKKPLSDLFFGENKTRKPSKKEGAGMFITEAVIETFETILGYFTNTVSFVRIGAFILSHAAMMSVVWKLSESVSGRNIFVLILGNILVTVIEGLIVGIQVLRLCYYEMFSRFYEGAGRAFRSYKEI
jgi:V/A-type H+-transporting ATPase subunit I